MSKWKFNHKFVRLKNEVQILLPGISHGNEILSNVTQKLGWFALSRPVHMHLRHVSRMGYDLMIEILWKIIFVLIIVLMIQTGRKFAHVMTAQLSWHVQICDLIWWLFLK